MQPLWLQGLFFGEERKPHNLITNVIRSKHLLLIVFRKVCEDMRHIKYLLSIMAVLVLLTGCSEKSETSGKEEKGDKETTVDASAATEQVQAEETKTAAQAATAQSAEPSGESNPAEDTNKAASSNTAASTNETPSSSTAASVKQTQESSSKPAASAQTAASKPSQGSPASQPSQAQASAPAAAPSQPAASEPQQEQKKETAMVTLSIRDNGTMILSKTTVELQEGDTVFAVLARTVKNKGIQMEYTGSGQSVYVQGINNLYEMDRGPLSGWRYSVNGALATRSAGVVKLSKGDKVEWRYTNDYKKDGQ